VEDVELEKEKTLSEEGISSGDLLRLYADMKAGGGLPSGLDLAEDILRQREQYGPVSLSRFSTLLQENSEVSLRVTLLSNFTQTLTPSILKRKVAPYLEALSALQAVIIEVLGHPSDDEIRIVAIRQNSPISIYLKGAAEAVEIARNFVVPWRRHHAEDIARLEILKGEVEIQMQKAGILEVQARTSKEIAEASKLLAEASSLTEQARKLRLENDRLALNLYREKVQLALEIVLQLAPTLSEVDRLSFAFKVLPAVEQLVTADFEIAASNLTSIPLLFSNPAPNQTPPADG
jgi:hypothetical protein